MDPPHGCRPWKPCLLHHPHHHLYHHHHHHLLFLCPHHQHHHHHHPIFNSHHHLRPNFTSFPQSPEPAASAAIPFPTHLNSETSGYKEARSDDPTLLSLQEQNHGEIGDDRLEEEDDAADPVFVLTDEWKEFFAKSEAKRRLEKQRAKKKGKRYAE